MTSLLELAHRQKWSAIILRSHHHPPEITLQDSDGFNVLHWACFNQPPLRVIRALLHHDTHSPLPAALTPDKDGLTPLHYACCCNASLDVISEMIRYCPDAVNARDGGGWTPLHFIYRIGGQEGWHSVQVAYRLLRQNADIANWKDRCWRCPLGLLYERYESVLKIELGRLRDDRRRRRVMLTGSVRDFWHLALLLVYAICKKTVRDFAMFEDDGDNDEVEEEEEEDELVVDWPLLQTLLRMQNCPQLITQFVLERLPHQARMQNPKQELPLHIAASNPFVKMDVIESLLMAYPEAASMRNTAGKLPLRVAIECGRTWKNGISSIIQAYPAAIAELDDELVPFVMEHLGKRGMLDVVWEVLRNKPNLVPGK